MPFRATVAVFVFASMGIVSVCGQSFSGATAVATGVTSVVTTIGGPASSSPSVTPITPTLDPTVSVMPVDGDGPVQPSSPRTLIAQIKDAAWSATPSLGTLSHRAGSFRARLNNVSVRGYVASDAPLIAGAVVMGSGLLPTYVRAVGPGLSQFGVLNPLNYPKLRVFRGNALAAETNYAEASLDGVASYVGAFPTTRPTGGRAFTDAALVGQVTAGLLTAHCDVDSGSPGVALVEFYDATTAMSGGTSAFRNFSVRGRVQTGEGLLVLGFVIQGEGSLTVLLRGVGPTLAQYGVSDPIADPQIELYHGTTKIASGNNWREDSRGSTVISDTAALVGAFPLSSLNEAALVVTLGEGSYSLLLRDTADRVGSAMAEIYAVGNPE